MSRSELAPRKTQRNGWNNPNIITGQYLDWFCASVHIYRPSERAWWGTAKKSCRSQIKSIDGHEWNGRFFISGPVTRPEPYQETSWAAACNLKFRGQTLTKLIMMRMAEGATSPVNWNPKNDRGLVLGDLNRMAIWIAKISARRELT